MIRTFMMSFVAAALLPMPASACSCAGPRSALEAESAVMILQGRVVRVESAGGWLSRVLYAGGFRPGANVAVEVEVERSWHGPSDRRTVVHTAGGGAACGYGFVVGEEYVIPVYAYGDGRLTTGLCGGVQTSFEARDVIPLLGEGHVPTVSTAHTSRGWTAFALLHAAASLLLTLFLAVRFVRHRRDRRQRERA